MLLELFEKIYIINLPHRLDRRHEMEVQLKRMNVRKNDPRIVFFPAVRPDDKAEFPSIGARGCFMSHLGVLRKIRDGKISTALVLEDDCNFRYKDKNLLSTASKAVAGSGWDIFYGGALNHRPSGKLVDGVEIMVPDIGLMGSHCIGVKGVVAGEIAEYFEKMLARPAGDPNGGPMHVDGAYSWYRKERPNRTTLMPMLEIAYQRSSATDVHHVANWQNLVGVRNIVRWTRKIKNMINEG